MTDNQKAEAARLQDEIHRAAFAVHAITGRTDQDVGQICAEFPDHDDVKAYLAAVKRRADFLALI